MPSRAAQKRAEHQALRGRMLSGQWERDLDRAIRQHIDTDRRPLWGLPELSRNPFRSISQQVGGVLYRHSPLVTSPSPADHEMLQQVDAAGAWSRLQRMSTDLVGLREELIRVDYTERGGLLLRPVEPYRVIAEADPANPREPVYIEELQLRSDPQGRPRWVWEITDIHDEDAPAHVILSADRTADLTGDYLVEPGVYQYVDDDGPYLPYTMYHAEDTGYIWDPWYGVEAVMGSLTVGVLLTFWVHGVKDGSFSTVLLIGGRMGDDAIEDTGQEARRRTLSVEPGSIIEVGPAEEGMQPTAIQLQPGFDPEKLITSIGYFEQGLSEYAGVSPADLVRTGADPRSGVSLSISREGLRTAQARYEPQLRRGDSRLLEICARVLNGATGSSYSTSGYRISYRTLPLSVQERQAEIDVIRAKLDRGLMSPVDAYLELHPGLSRVDAIEALDQIRRDTAAYGMSQPRGG